jgi:hypothetical protein
MIENVKRTQQPGDTEQSRSRPIIAGIAARGGETTAFPFGGGGSERGQESSSVAAESEGSQPAIPITNNTLQLYQGQRPLEQDLIRRRLARKSGASVEAVGEALNTAAKEHVTGREHGELYHYHRVPFDNGLRVIASEALLSRSEQESAGSTDVPTHWSASSEVMMTRDHYNTEGVLTKLGLSESYANIGPEVFALDQSVMEAKGYDLATDLAVPRASRIPLSEHGAAILIDDERHVTDPARLAEMTQRLTDALGERGLSQVPVRPITVWKREHYHNR